ncbi:MAG: hypothetical protein CMM07_19540, partial [Rhodopirellula sp.]|nr:hypothetical protein [Rhodopirellula sp.]
MFRNEALHAGLEQTAAALLEFMAQQRSGSQGSALVSARNQSRESMTDSATGHRLTSEKVPDTTSRNTQHENPRNRGGRTHTASASGSGDPYRQTFALNSSSAEGQFASQSERLASKDARVSGPDSKASALSFGRVSQPDIPNKKQMPELLKQFTPREEGAGITSPASLTPDGSQLLTETLASLGIDHSKASTNEVIAALLTSLHSKTSSDVTRTRTEQLSLGAEVESQLQAVCHESSREGGLLSSVEGTTVGPAIAPGTSTTVETQQQQHDAYNRFMFSGSEAPGAPVATDYNMRNSDSNRSFALLSSKPANKTLLAKAVIASARIANAEYFRPQQSTIKSDDTVLNIESGQAADSVLAQNILTGTKHEKDGSGFEKTTLAKPNHDVTNESNNSNMCPSAKVQADASVTDDEQMTNSPHTNEGTTGAFSKGGDGFEEAALGSDEKARKLLKTIEKILSQQSGIQLNNGEVEQLEESLTSDSSRAGHITDEDHSVPCSTANKTTSEPSMTGHTTHVGLSEPCSTLNNAANSPSLDGLSSLESQAKSRMILAELAEREEEKQVVEQKSAAAGVVSTLEGGISDRTQSLEGLGIWKVVQIMSQLTAGELGGVMEHVQGHAGCKHSPHELLDHFYTVLHQKLEGYLATTTGDIPGNSSPLCTLYALLTIPEAREELQLPTSSDVEALADLMPTHFIAFLTRKGYTVSQRQSYVCNGNSCSSCMLYNEYISSCDQDPCGLLQPGDVSDGTGANNNNTPVEPAGSDSQPPDGGSGDNSNEGRGNGSGAPNAPVNSQHGPDDHSTEHKCQVCGSPMLPPPGDGSKVHKAMVPLFGGKCVQCDAHIHFACLPDDAYGCKTLVADADDQVSSKNFTLGILKCISHHKPELGKSLIDRRIDAARALCTQSQLLSQYTRATERAFAALRTNSSRADIDAYTEARARAQEALSAGVEKLHEMLRLNQGVDVKGPCWAMNEVATYATSQSSSAKVFSNLRQAYKQIVTQYSAEIQRGQRTSCAGGSLVQLQKCQEGAPCSDCLRAERTVLLSSAHKACQNVPELAASKAEDKGESYSGASPGGVPQSTIHEPPKDLNAANFCAELVAHLTTISKVSLGMTGTGPTGSLDIKLETIYVMKLLNSHRGTIWDGRSVRSTMSALKQLMKNDTSTMMTNQLDAALMLVVSNYWQAWSTGIFVVDASTITLDISEDEMTTLGWETVKSKGHDYEATYGIPVDSVNNSTKILYETVNFVNSPVTADSDLLSVYIKHQCTAEHQRWHLNYDFFHRLRDLLTNDANSYDPDKATFGDLGSEAYVAVWILTRERWSVSSSKEYTSELEKVTKAFAAKVKQVEKLTVKVRDPKNPTKAPVSVSQKACPTDKVQRTKWFKDVMALLNQPRFFLMFVSLDQFARYFDPDQALLWFNNQTRVEDKDGKWVYWKDVLAKVHAYVTEDCLTTHQTYDRKVYQSNLSLLMNIRMLAGRLMKTLVGRPYTDRPANEEAATIARLRQRSDKDAHTPLWGILTDLFNQALEPASVSEEQQRLVYNINLPEIAFNGGTLNHHDLAIPTVKYVEALVRREQETKDFYNDKERAAKFIRAIHQVLENTIKDTSTASVNIARRQLYHYARGRVLDNFALLVEDVQTGRTGNQALSCLAKLKQPVGNWVLVEVKVNQTMFVAAQVAMYSLWLSCQTSAKSKAGCKEINMLQQLLGEAYPKKAHSTSVSVGNVHTPVITSARGGRGGGRGRGGRGGRGRGRDNRGSGRGRGRGRGGTPIPVLPAVDELRKAFPIEPGEFTSKATIAALQKRFNLNRIYSIWVKSLPMKVQKALTIKSGHCVQCGEGKMKGPAAKEHWERGTCVDKKQERGKGYYPEQTEAQKANLKKQNAVGGDIYKALRSTEFESLLNAMFAWNLMDWKQRKEQTKGIQQSFKAILLSRNITPNDAEGKPRTLEWCKHNKPRQGGARAVTRTPTNRASSSTTNAVSSNPTPAKAPAPSPAPAPAPAPTVAKAPINQKYVGDPINLGDNLGQFDDARLQDLCDKTGVTKIQAVHMMDLVSASSNSTKATPKPAPAVAIGQVGQVGLQFIPPSVVEKAQKEVHEKMAKWSSKLKEGIAQADRAAAQHVAVDALNVMPAPAGQTHYVDGYGPDFMCRFEDEDIGCLEVVSHDHKRRVGHTYMMDTSTCHGNEQMMNFADFDTFFYTTDERALQSSRNATHDDPGVFNFYQETTEEKEKKAKKGTPEYNNHKWRTVRARRSPEPDEHGDDSGKSLEFASLAEQARFEQDYLEYMAGRLSGGRLEPESEAAVTDRASPELVVTDRASPELVAEGCYEQTFMQKQDSGSGEEEEFQYEDDSNDAATSKRTRKRKTVVESDSSSDDTGDVNGGASDPAKGGSREPENADSIPAQGEEKQNTPSKYSLISPSKDTNKSPTEPKDNGDGLATATDKPAKADSNREMSEEQLAKQSAKSKAAQAARDATQAAIDAQNKILEERGRKKAADKLETQAEMRKKAEKARQLRQPIRNAQHSAWNRVSFAVVQQITLEADPEHEVEAFQKPGIRIVTPPSFGVVFQYQVKGTKSIYRLVLQEHGGDIPLKELKKNWVCVPGLKVDHGPIGIGTRIRDGYRKLDDVGSVGSAATLAHQNINGESALVAFLSRAFCLDSNATESDPLLFENFPDCSVPKLRPVSDSTPLVEKWHLGYPVSNFNFGPALEYATQHYTQYAITAWVPKKDKRGQRNVLPACCDRRFPMRLEARVHRIDSVTSVNNAPAMATAVQSNDDTQPSDGHTVTAQAIIIKPGLYQAGYNQDFDEAPNGSWTKWSTQADRPPEGCYREGELINIYRSFADQGTAIDRVPEWKVPGTMNQNELKIANFLHIAHSTLTDSVDPPESNRGVSATYEGGSSWWTLDIGVTDAFKSAVARALFTKEERRMGIQTTRENAEVEKEQAADRHFVKLRNWFSKESLLGANPCTFHKLGFYTRAIGR